MDRPYIFCHMMTAPEGKIMSCYMETPQRSAAGNLLYKWFQTAVLLGNEKAIPFRNAIETTMNLDEISMANPLIQSTLQLIEMYDTHRQKEVEKFEKDVENQYRDFGVSLSEFKNEPEEKTTQSVGNPLIDALIRDQNEREAAAKKAAEKKAREEAKAAEKAARSAEN